MFFARYFILFSVFFSSVLVLTCNALTSDFSNDLEGWEPLNPWLRSSVNGMSEGDFYMRMPVGINPGNRGSKLIAFNPTDAWTGDFVAKGVTGVSLNFSNFSESDPVYLRIAISNLASPQQSGGTWWVTDAYEFFAPESGWGNASFQINESSMHRVGNLSGELGLDTFEETMSNINGFRILSSTLGYAAIGDEFYGVVGMDDIQLVTIPEPSFISLLLAIFSLTFFYKRVR
jgi:hypothetical protein